MSTDPAMPELGSEGTTDSEWERTVLINQPNNEDFYSDDSDSSDEQDSDVEIFSPIRPNEIFDKNNLRFLTNDEFKLNAIKLDELPFELNDEISAGAINRYGNVFTNRKVDPFSNAFGNVFDEHTNFITIEGNSDPKIPCILFSNAIYSIDNKECILYGQNENSYIDHSDEIEDVYFNNTKVIRSRNAQWYVHVPITHQDGTIEKTWIFADPGANTPCVKTQWAIDNFSNMIVRNKILRKMLTPGGPIKPKYSLWMAFPAKKNTVLKVKMNLVNDLPVDVLADINMLEAFGYTFKDETPPIFRHDEKPEIELDLKEDDEFISNRTDSNWFNCVTQMKMNQIEHGALYGDDTGKIGLIDKIYNDDDEIIYNSSKDVKNYDQTICTSQMFDDNKVKNASTTTSVNLIRKTKNNEWVHYLDITEEEMIEIDCGTYDLNAIMAGVVEDKNGIAGRIYRKCLMLMPKQTLLASKAEVKEAKKVFKNERLKFPDYSYLRAYESKFGNIFKNLYSEVMKWKEDYSCIFATHTYSRKTMYTTPAKLGIKPEHRDKVMFCPQYPISAEKRIHMINYTLINEENGFWYKIPRSQHGIPYLMVPKRNSKGIITRYRPAFDARIVNQYCELMQCSMPTFNDFRNLHQKGGLTTLADIKNFFDCIPLWWKDRKYAVCFTPMGIYCMLCMTYGFMNAAPEAQKRTNDLAMNVTNALSYIDDIQIKHPLREGTKGVIESLKRLGDYCIEKNIQLNPKKFYPATDVSEAFGFKNTLIGQMVSESYRRKILAFAKPTTKAEMRSFDGLCNYVNHHLFNNKKLFYWMNKLEEETDPHTKHKRLKWTEQADLAWDQLHYLLNNLPLLHHPTIDGKYCLQVDACNYGIGACLFQEQVHPETGVKDWYLIDLWSKVMPTQLRHCHSMVHEAYSVVAACEHWQFYLIRGNFILSTDNMAVATVFGKEWKNLSPITQKQLIRLRSKINSFNFTSYHVEGLKNHLADGLSRFTVELIKLNKENNTGKYNLGLTALDSDDTMTPKLTNEEKLSLDLIKKENQYLTDKYGNLKNWKKNSMKNKNVSIIISDSYYVEPQIMSIYQPRKADKFTELNRKVEMCNDNIENDFVMMMDEYIEETPYLERERMKKYLNLRKEDILTKTDDQMGVVEKDELFDTMCSMIENLDELNHEKCEELEKIVDDEYWLHLTELKLLNSVLNGELVNAIEDNIDDDISIDEEEISDEEEQYGVKTRGQLRREKEKERSKREDDDTVEQEKHFHRLNENFENVREQMEAHEDLMLELFGGRNSGDAIDYEKYREYQESDNMMAIAIDLFKSGKQENWNENDRDTLSEYEPRLFRMLCKNKLVIENNVLKCKIYDKLKGHEVNKIIVPFYLRGKLMDFMHHNVLKHHLSFKYTYRGIASRFWWPTISKDVKRFCKSCVSCQFVKGYPQHRAPLIERYRPAPRQHVFADILGPVYQRYYVLVLVDYATGYSMLIPMEGCDAMSIARAIFEHWIRIFGCFKFLETDWGSGFTSNLIQYLGRLLGFEHQIAEPRNHRSIGKVERVIGFLQGVINHYNLLLNKQLTDDDDSFTAWMKIRVLLPFIQFAFNQRVMRITGISPNMAIFGSNLNDLSDIGRMSSKIEDFAKDESLSNRDFEILRDLRDNIARLDEIAQTNWKSVTKLSVKSYNNKYNITPAKIIQQRRQFRVNDKVLYFIGDKQVARYKWREKWSGPWNLKKRLNDSTMIIEDPRNGNQKRVSIDRLKRFNERDYLNYEDYIHHDEEYLQYQKDLLSTLSNYNVNIPNQEWNLDYTIFDNSKSSVKVDNDENMNQENENGNQEES